MSIPTKKAIIEVNPFYIKPKTRDLVGLLKNLAGKEVMIWTYEGDPIASKLALRGSLARKIRTAIRVFYLLPYLKFSPQWIMVRDTVRQLLLCEI